MPRTPQEWTFGYRDLMDATGLTLENLYQFRSRNDFDPENFASVVKFIARHGKLKLRKEILNYMISRELTEKPGLPKKRGRK